MSKRLIKSIDDFMIRLNEMLKNKYLAKGLRRQVQGKIEECLEMKRLSMGDDKHGQNS